MPGDASLEATLWDAVAALVSAIDGRNRAMGHSMRVADNGCDLSTLPQLREEAEQFRHAFLARTDWQ